MIAFLILFLHVLVSPFKTQAQLEAEIVLLRHQLGLLARTLEAKADAGGSTALRLALSPVSVGVERCHDYPTGDHHSMASDGLPTELALEVALSGRSAEDTRGDPAPDPGDEPGQSAVGRTAHTWRTAQARHRGRPIDGRQVHGEEWARAGADLDDLSAQPCGRHRRDGLPDCADGRLSAAFRSGHPQAPTATPDLAERHRPSDSGVDRQITDALPWDEAPDYMVRDRDRCYGHVVTKRLSAMGIRDHPIAPRSPWQNGHADRLIGSIRRECLDHIVVFGEAHLRRILAAYAVYYNELRTHLSLSKDSPCHRSVRRLGQLAAQPILGGLHHEYCRT